jgi:UbiA prenyltransferase family
VVVTAAVFAGQLTISWGNDLLDTKPDRDAGRRDKPLATGELTSTVVLTSLVLAAIACVVLSFLVGWRSALVHLGVGVTSGHLYNAALKGSVWSWLPYAMAFGTLPAAVTLADNPTQLASRVDARHRGGDRRCPPADCKSAGDRSRWPSWWASPVSRCWGAGAFPSPRRSASPSSMSPC